MHVRIVDTPPGQAPLEIRKAWVGVILPVSSGFDGSRKALTFGVLNAPANFLGALRDWVLGRFKPVEGFVVDASTAVDVLARHHPSAADWWRTNTPRMLRPGQKFIFHAHVCEPVPEASKENPGS